MNLKWKYQCGFYIQTLLHINSRRRFSRRSMHQLPKSFSYSRLERSADGSEYASRCIFADLLICIYSASPRLNAETCIRRPSLLQTLQFTSEALNRSWLTRRRAFAVDVYAHIIGYHPKCLEKCLPVHTRISRVYAKFDVTLMRWIKCYKIKCNVIKYKSRHIDTWKEWFLF